MEVQLWEGLCQRTGELQSRLSTKESVLDRNDQALVPLLTSLWLRALRGSISSLNASVDPEDTVAGAIS